MYCCLFILETSLETQNIVASNHRQPRATSSTRYRVLALLCRPTRTLLSLSETIELVGIRKFLSRLASSDPSDPNCIVAALTLHGHRLAFCRPNDASWTLQYKPDTPLKGGFGLTDLHFHEGELYATVGRKIDAILMFDPIEVLFQSHSGSDEADAFKGKLLGWLKYEKMNNIGEQAIFIGDIGARTLIAMAKPTNSMPVIDKLGGHGSGNCIYFTNEKDDRIGVYNLADETLKYWSSSTKT
ncbi:hypothetical protein ACLB2K_029452 [Fragaria x ananassa]